MAVMRYDISTVCIVVVFYNPSIEQISQYEELSVLCPVVAVDNSNCQSKVKGLNYIPLCENKGIAAAQNIGIEYACKNGYDFILLMDQDSIVDASFVRNMLEEFERLREKHSEIGFLGPVFIDEKSQTEYKNIIREGENYSQVDNVIASGCLISIDAIKNVGGMDESLFIDLVDFEWGWRAKSKGYYGFMTRRVKMLHSIGKEYHNWHGFVLGLSSPFRYYYQYRNTLWLIRRCYVPLRWKVKSILRRLLDIILVPLASKESLECIKYILKGIKKGLFQENIPIYNTYE